MDLSPRRILGGVGVALLALAALGMGPAAPPPPVEGVVDALPLAQVCYSSAQGIVCVVRVNLPVTSAVTTDPVVLLEALLGGPTKAERARGLRSAIPPGTELAGAAVDDTTLTVRLRLPEGAVVQLDRQAVEEIVRQVASTLEPLGWRRLHVEALDRRTQRFSPLSDLLPRLAPPRKSGVAPESDRVGAASETAAPLGQPPGPGQGQPQGALTGKTVYVSAGHGWKWGSSGWRTQRPPYPTAPYVGPIIEDHNNAEVVNQYLLQYLWNAGAMAWPVRERDMNAVAVIVNNDAPGAGSSFVESGSWVTSTHAGYDLDEVGHTYRWAETVAGAPTAAVTYTAALPAPGRYAVYVWYQHGANRPPDARYTVHHSGGQTTVLVDQTRHGLTWHYVGTYGFSAEQGGRVALDNSSSIVGRAVIADAVRVGGGTFDDLRGIETSAANPPNKPWWEVAAYYYAQRQGLDPGDFHDFNDVIARPMYARWEHSGSGDDALYVSWHTNGASSGYQEDTKGTVSYIHDSRPTEGSAALQAAIHAERVHDIRTGWDPDWGDLGTRSLDLGEVRELWDEDADARMPGVLLEIGFHDHPGDTDAIKDPRFELLAARAVYQGIVKYYEQRDGVDLTLLPEPPVNLRVLNDGAARVAARRNPPPSDATGLGGDPATGYRVYVSGDGIGWSDGEPVAGTEYLLAGLASGQLVFVRVSATNAGGESFPTETLGARAGDSAGVLVVNGFDRLNRFALVSDTDSVEGLNMRMLLDQMNRYDYVVQHGGSIDYAFDSAANEAVADGLVPLDRYQVVDWILGEEATMDATLDGAERAALAAYLDGGGALFISGSELGWDLDDQGRDPGFYRAYLRAGFDGDDAGTYEVAPVAGSIFAGLANFRFDATGEYDADYADRLVPFNGGVAALTYAGGDGGTAAVQYADGCGRLVNFGFPFETIPSGARASVMARVMDFLDECLVAPPNTSISSPQDGLAYASVPAFEGSATAAGDVQRVEVSLLREADGAYWDGAGWGAVPWHTAVGAAQWSFTMPLTMPVGAYTVQARTWDTRAVSDTTPAEAEFRMVPPAAYLPAVLWGYGPLAECADVIVDGGFETGEGWQIVETSYAAGYANDLVRSGDRSMRVGIPPGQAGGGAITYSSISQTVALPAGSTATLRYWIYPIYQDDDDEDLQYVWLVDAAGTTQVLATSRDDGWGWDEHTLVLSAFAGQTIRLHFSVKNDGDSDVATIYLDDVRLEVCPP